MGPGLSWLLVGAFVGAGVCLFYAFIWLTRLLDAYWAWRYLRPHDRAGSVEETIAEIRALPTVPEPELFDWEREVS